MVLHRETNLTCLRDEIQRGTYAVDPRAVAEAILRRLDALGHEPDEDEHDARRSARSRTADLSRR
jgi:hypothetical protein